MNKPTMHVMHVRNPVLRSTQVYSKGTMAKHIAGISNLGGATIAFAYTNNVIAYVSSRVASTDNFNKQVGRYVTTGRLGKSIDVTYNLTKLNLESVQNTHVKFLSALELETYNFQNTTRSAFEIVLNDYLKNSNKHYTILNNTIIQASPRLIAITKMFNLDFTGISVDLEIAN